MKYPIRYTLYAIRNTRQPSSVFCRLSSVNCPPPSTTVENPLQISSFMQNEPKFRKSQMNVNKVLTMNYEKKDTWWTGKKRTQTNPNKPNFQNAQMNVNYFDTKHYEKNHALRPRENKPNQACPEQRRMDPISQKAKMNVNSLLTRDYENQPFRSLPVGLQRPWVCAKMVRSL